MINLEVLGNLLLLVSCYNSRFEPLLQDYTNPPRRLYINASWFWLIKNLFVWETHFLWNMCIVCVYSTRLFSRVGNLFANRRDILYTTMLTFLRNHHKTQHLSSILAGFFPNWN